MTRLPDHTLDAAARVVVHLAAESGKTWHPVAVRRRLEEQFQRDDRLRLDEVLTAAGRAASDPAAQTPAALAWDTYRPRPTFVEPIACAVCYQPSPQACANIQRHVSAEMQPRHDYEPQRGRLARTRP